MSNVSDPFRFAVDVTPNDVTVLTPTRGLWIGTAGDVAVRMYGSQATVVFPSVPVGLFPVMADQVRATGTTAAGIKAVW